MSGDDGLAERVAQLEREMAALKRMFAQPRAMPANGKDGYWAERGGQRYWVGTNEDSGELYNAFLQAMASQEPPDAPA